MHSSLRIVVALAVVALGAAGAVAAAAALRTHASPAGAGADLTGRGYHVRVSVTPNRSTALNDVAVVLTRNGHVVTGARVELTTTMLDMRMPGVTRELRFGAGRYAYGSTVLGMAGRWRLRVRVEPPNGAPFSLGVVDRVAP